VTSTVWVDGEGLGARAAILGCTMNEHPVPRAPAREQPGRFATTAAEEPAPTPKQQQAIAHSRGRICKVRNCDVCAPLRERRRLKKAQRKADARARAHDKGEPCGRSNCPVPVCVKAQHADGAAPAPAVAPTGRRAENPETEAGGAPRRQHERHRAGVPCGSESCPIQVCVEGAALERARRHRARRPCRSPECSNPICVASRSST
jgi:hypothetical protein